MRGGFYGGHGGWKVMSAFLQREWDKVLFSVGTVLLLFFLQWLRERKSR